MPANDLLALADLAREIEERWPGLTLTMMTSNGGLEAVEMDLDEPPPGDLRRTPIRLALSGPAAAGNAVVRVAQVLDLQPTAFDDWLSDVLKEFHYPDDIAPGTKRDQGARQKVRRSTGLCTLSIR